LPYRLLVPPGHHAAPVPLVLFLHGAGERGHDNLAQLVHGVAIFAEPEVRRRHPAYVVAPQCPAGQRWVEKDWSAAAHRLPPAPSLPLQQVLALLPRLRDEFPIDPDRIYVTGLSMGGFGTWDIVVREPRLFAAAVPICGGGDESFAPSIAPLPIWAFHGELDPVVPVARSRNMIAALRRAGGDPRYTEYPGEGHSCWTRAYHEPDLLPWLFSQRR
jgi:predicted peptidase